MVLEVGAGAMRFSNSATECQGGGSGRRPSLRKPSYV
jgi:hypothetical protein